MKFIRNWEQDLMNTAIRKDFKCSSKSRKSHTRER